MLNLSQNTRRRKFAAQAGFLEGDISIVPKRVLKVAPQRLIS